MTSRFTVTISSLPFKPHDDDTLASLKAPTSAASHSRLHKTRPSSPQTFTSLVYCVFFLFVVFLSSFRFSPIFFSILYHQLSLPPKTPQYPRRLPRLCVNFRAPLFPPEEWPSDSAATATIPHNPRTSRTKNLLKMKSLLPRLTQAASFSQLPTSPCCGITYSDLLCGALAAENKSATMINEQKRAGRPYE